MVISKRAMWIGGLAGGAVLLAGGLAFASSKQSTPITPGPNPPSPPTPPTPDCSSAVPDASNPDAVAIANSIVFHNTPVPWSEGGSYKQVVDGVTFQFRMERNGDTKIVSVWRCA